MTRYAPLLIAAGALFFANPAQAEEGVSCFDSYYCLTNQSVNAINFSLAGSGNPNFSLANFTLTGCGYFGVIEFDLSTDMGKAHKDVLLAARTSGRQIHVVYEKVEGNVCRLVSLTYL